MAFDSAGVYTTASGSTTAAPGDTIASTTWNAIFTDIATNGLTVLSQRQQVNAQTGVTYIFLASDRDLLVTFSNAGSVAVTLPQATGNFAKWNTLARNKGVGTVTITPTTSTINGAATLTLTTNQAVYIVSDGTNYQTWLVPDIAAKTIVIDAGTATQAPMKYQSGTVLTSPLAGVKEYDGTCFYSTAVASARQVSVAEQFTCLTADYTLTDSATAQKAFNATTNGAVTLAGSTSYFFEGHYLITNTGATSHTWATLFAGAATITELQYSANTTQAGTSASGLFATQANYQTTSSASLPSTALVVTAASISATENVIIYLKGIIRVNAGGTFIPQVKLSVQPNGTEKMLKGSYFRMWAVGTSSVATIGNWS